VAPSGLALVPLTRDHFEVLARWLTHPHVAEWWGEHTPQSMEADFGPSIDGHDPTQMFVCMLDDEPVGLVQIYRLDDNPEYAAAVALPGAAGLDLFIGEAELLNRGFGTNIIKAATARLWEDYPEITAAMAGPSVGNARSIRAFEKAGFTATGAVTVPGEADSEMLMVLPRPTA
jgi:aminoglycoside 6'-N-acetyltransferase